MRLYDYPHPEKPGRLIRGYDRPHAIRTARMCAAVAAALGHDPARVRQYQIACFLHDLGRAGLDRVLFGRIWSWAKQHGIPVVHDLPGVGANLQDHLQLRMAFKVKKIGRAHV